MVKGFIFFDEGKIPFVVENYRMELFSDNNLLNSFVKKHNLKTNFILKGESFRIGTQSQNVTFLVEKSTGSTCYLRGYIININSKQKEIDAIGFQSSFLDDIFRYKYNYLDLVRDGMNLAVEPKEIYKIPFSMHAKQYEMCYCIGHHQRLGLLEDFNKNGEVLIPLHTGEIQECYDLSLVLFRLAMFMTQYADVPFKQITLYKNGLQAGWFYIPFVSEVEVSGYDILYYNFDVNKYIPKILNNIAMDAGNKIVNSIPLGHLGNSNNMFTPQRFIEQVMSFEYLFYKLEPRKAKDKKYPLKEKLKYSFDWFPEILSSSNFSADEVSEKIKRIRNTIVHGNAYYYDFQEDLITNFIIIILDKLNRNLSLKWLKFSNEDIQEYNKVFL